MLDRRRSDGREQVSSFQVSTCPVRRSRERVVGIQSRFRSKPVLLDTFHGANRLNPISFAANGGDCRRPLRRSSPLRTTSAFDCLIFRIPQILTFPFGTMAMGKLAMRWPLKSLPGFSLFPISKVCNGASYTKPTKSDISDASRGRTLTDFQPNSCERVTHGRAGAP